MYPILTPHVVVIHDVNFRANPTFFSRTFVLWYCTALMLSASRMKMIFTVSEFSKHEILRYYKVDPLRISVVYSAWSHFERIYVDDKILSRHKLMPGEYYFALSSMAPNKNFAWIAKVACNNPGQMFVIAGMSNKRVFGGTKITIPKNMLLLGYISDGEAKSLMKSCKAFLFPSIYEGFGLPPLEALSVGAPVIVSSTSSLPEIYGDTVHYIDPHRYNVNLELLLDEQVKNPENILSKYKWQKSAEIFHINTSRLIRS
jgi:glycosyltransferase involved in cell wall biosynthesis